MGNKYDDLLKVALVAALVIMGVTSAMNPQWTGASAIITGIFALLNFNMRGSSPN